MTDRIVYLCCKANGELDVDEDGSVYGTICTTLPPSAPPVRAYVLADELDRANQRIAKLTEALEKSLIEIRDLEWKLARRSERIEKLEEEVELAYSCCGA